MGGGAFVQGVGWVDKNNPQYANGTTASGAAANAPASPNGQATAGSLTPAQQATASSTNSATPGAAPATNTTNQGTQDVVRNSYLAQATQPTTVDPNDPVIKNQVDAYRAATDRASNDFVNQQAEAAGPYATGALRGQERMVAEKGGQSVAGFQAQLVANELQNKRAEVQQALTSLGGLITSDRQQALQQQLADLDAQIKTLGINTAATTASNQLGVQQELGVGGLNLGLMQALLGNQQANNSMGLNAAEYEAYLNNQALQNVLPPA
jgi:hypothetical protein